MQTEFCKQLGIEAPIFAFTHCRDVVVAVSKAGGIGVLGAVGFNVDQLKEEQVLLIVPLSIFVPKVLHIPCFRLIHQKIVN